MAPRNVEWCSRKKLRLLNRKARWSSIYWPCEQKRGLWPGIVGITQPALVNHQDLSLWWVGGVASWCLGVMEYCSPCSFTPPFPPWCKTRMGRRGERKSRRRKKQSGGWVGMTSSRNVPASRGKFSTWICVETWSCLYFWSPSLTTFCQIGIFLHL